MTREGAYPDLVVHPGGIVVVEVRLLDGIAIAALRRTLEELVGIGRPRLIVDMQRVTDVPRSAVALLMETERAARTRGGSLLVACRRGVSRRTVLHEVLPVYPSRAAALHVLTHADAGGTVP
jgi:anti-anti-sigma regulatory factor